MPILASALVLETLAALAFFGLLPNGGYPLTTYLLAHLAAAALATTGLLPLLPRRYRTTQASGIPLFALALAIPLLGIPGLLAGLLASLHWPRRDRPIPFRATAIPDLPYTPLPVRPQPLFGEGGLAGVLRQATDPERRVRAIMATRQLRDQDAIPILRIALRDPVDDVRLLAYSLLDGKEQRINQRIETLRAALNEDDPAAGHIHEQLLDHYWELAYLGLASGEVCRHVLLQALQHADAAIARLGETPALLFRRGRVRLRLADYAGAQADLEQARDRGLDAGDVLPYLAEVAYARKRWHDVPDLLAPLADQRRLAPPLSQVVAYWSPPA